jgi:methyl-accepting chemotaxis protein
MVLLINWSITKPIIKLTEAADAISKGDSKIGELKVVSNDEIGKLTESFNRMSASIKLLLEEGKKQ